MRISGTEAALKLDVARAQQRGTPTAAQEQQTEAPTPAASVDISAEAQRASLNPLKRPGSHSAPNVWHAPGRRVILPTGNPSLGRLTPVPTTPGGTPSLGRLTHLPPTTGGPLEVGTPKVPDFPTLMPTDPTGLAPIATQLLTDPQII